jgi:hypothetical protein
MPGEITPAFDHYGVVSSLWTRRAGHILSTLAADLPLGRQLIPAHGP